MPHPHLPEYSGKMFNTRMYVINGDAPNHTFEYLSGFPDLEFIYPPTAKHPRDYSRYYGFGILALDQFRYDFLSTPKVPFGAKENVFVGVKMIYSPDEGKTWKNQDGSPIYWEDWDERNSQNMLFFKEPEECFSLLTVLQMGKNYEYNTDGYVYIYAPNGNVDGKMNQLVMLRVKKDNILERSSYEYFSSMNADGTVNWRIGHPHGGQPYSWQPSVVYNKPLNVYMR